MKYIITENQYKIINEALGVPSSIVEAGEEMYYIIADDLKSITEKEEEYEFSGEVDFTIGEKRKITIDGSSGLTYKSNNLKCVSPPS